MGIGREFVRGYELDREGDAFVTGNPRDAGLTNPETANDVRTTGLSGEPGETDDVLLAGDSTAERDTHTGDFSDDVRGQGVQGDVNQIREGMRVIDAAGDEIGEVKSVSFGDPQAATTEGEEIDTGNTFVDDLVTPFAGGGDLDVAEPARSRLLRMGYVKIDGKGWFDKDRYARMDEVAGVSGDEIRLRVGKDQLVTG